MSREDSFSEDDYLPFKEEDAMYPEALKSARVTRNRNDGTDLVYDAANGDQGDSSDTRRMTFEHMKQQFRKFAAYKSDLETEFKKSAYPDKSAIEDISRRLGLTVKQVTKWFDNRRNRPKRKNGSSTRHRGRPPRWQQHRRGVTVRSNAKRSSTDGESDSDSTLESDASHSPSPRSKRVHTTATAEAADASASGSSSYEETVEFVPSAEQDSNKACEKLAGPAPVQTVTPPTSATPSLQSTPAVEGVRPVEAGDGTTGSAFVRRSMIGRTLTRFAPVNGTSLATVHARSMPLQFTLLGPADSPIASLFNLPDILPQAQPQPQSFSSSLLLGAMQPHDEGDSMARRAKAYAQMAATARAAAALPDPASVRGSSTALRRLEAATKAMQRHAARLAAQAPDASAAHSHAMPQATVTAEHGPHWGQLGGEGRPVQAAQIELFVDNPSQPSAAIARSATAQQALPVIGFNVSDLAR